MASQVYSPSQAASAWENGGDIPSNIRLTGNLTTGANDALSTDYDLTITQSFTIGQGGTVVVEGDLYVIGSLTIGKSASLLVNGSLYVGGNVLLLNPSAALTISQACYVGGDFTSNNGTSVLFSDDFVTYIGGEATLYNNNTLAGTATIIVVGTIDIQNNAVVGAAPPNSPLIISIEGDINLENNGSVEGYFYAPEGHIEIANNASVDGAVVGQSVTVNQNAEVTFRTDGPTDLPGTGEPMVLSIETYDIQ
jgi:cytoskeletal protein CcmA (bactofilin family)